MVDLPQDEAWSSIFGPSGVESARGGMSGRRTEGKVREEGEVSGSGRDPADPRPILSPSLRSTSFGRRARCVCERGRKASSHAHAHRLVITFTFETAVERLVERVLVRVERVLVPRLAVVAAQDHDLALAAAQRRELRHLDDDGPARRARKTQ